MSKKFSLPKRHATEAVSPTPQDSGANQNLMPSAFPLDRTNLRKDFTRQAEELKKKIVLGPTPTRVERPKNNLTLKKNGTLSGDIDSVKQTGSGVTIDLTERAKAVKESVKRPVFRRKSTAKEEVAQQDVQDTEDILREVERAGYDVTNQEDVRKYLEMAGVSKEDSDKFISSVFESVPATEEVKSEDDTEVTLDERDSEDKQPKEAVACEARFPAFNKREKDWISSRDERGVRSAVAAGSLSRVRGNQILSSMGITEEIEEDVFTKPTDAGEPLEQPSTEARRTHKLTDAEWQALVATDDKSMESFQDKLTNAIESDIPCEVVYECNKPCRGKVTGVSKEDAERVKSVIESLGAKAQIISAKEDCQVVFTQEEDVPTMKWYALVLNKKDPSRVQQLTLTTNGGATQDEVTEYLRREYGNEGVIRVSATKIV